MSQQLPLEFHEAPAPKRSAFDEIVPARPYDGETIDHRKDHARLRRQHALVFAAMCDGAWRTLAEISRLTEAPQASVSARLRDFRKAKFGGHSVERRRVADELGTYEYRLRIASAARRVACMSEGLAHELL